MTSSIRTPAKLNLGLEVLGNRADGLHELATIFQAVDIFDEFRMIPAHRFAYSSDRSIPSEADLVRPILERAAVDFGWNAAIQLVKHIPVAAGLGGGSSDAGLALRLRHAAGGTVPPLEEAARIGADVPFFLRGGTARGSGIGTVLEQLKTPRLWFVVHTPILRLEGKTGLLFQGLNPGDFSDGSLVEAIAATVETDRLASLESLPNAFERQMRAFPQVDRALRVTRALAGRAALTGAGPSTFSWHTSEREARAVCTEARKVLDGWTIVCRAIPEYDDQASLRAFHRKLVGGPGG